MVGLEVKLSVWGIYSYIMHCPVMEGSVLKLVLQLGHRRAVQRTCVQRYSTGLQAVGLGWGFVCWRAEFRALQRLYAAGRARAVQSSRIVPHCTDLQGSSWILSFEYVRLGQSAVKLPR